MSEEELSQSRLRVGGWLPSHSSPRPGGERRRPHRVGVPAVPPSPGEQTVAAPVPERQHLRLLLLTGAVAAALTAASAVAAVRPDDPAATVVSVGALQPALPPGGLDLPPVGPALAPPSSPPPSRPTPRPSPVLPGRPTGSPNTADRADRSGAAVPPLNPGRGGPAATAPAEAQGPPPTVGSRAPAPVLAVGRTLSLAPASRPAERVRHSGSQVRVDLIRATNSAAVREDADFVVRAGLADAGCVSFELIEQPGSFLRHRDFVVFLQESDGGGSFGRDATFCPAAAAGGGISLRSKSDPGRFLAAQGTKVVLDPAARPTASMIFLIRAPL